MQKLIKSGTAMEPLKKSTGSRNTTLTILGGKLESKIKSSTIKSGNKRGRSTKKSKENEKNKSKSKNTSMKSSLSTSLSTIAWICILKERKIRITKRKMKLILKRKSLRIKVSKVLKFSSPKNPNKMKKLQRKAKKVENRTKKSKKANNRSLRSPTTFKFSLKSLNSWLQNLLKTSKGLLMNWSKENNFSWESAKKIPTKKTKTWSMTSKVKNQRTTLKRRTRTQKKSFQLYERANEWKVIETELYL